MNTHVTVGGRTIAYAAPSPELAAFVERVRAAASDDAVTPDAMLALVYGADNPLLDTATLLGRAIVTAAAFGHPVYHVLTDLLAAKDVRLGRLDLDRAYAAYTVDVPTAAVRLGLTPQGVRNAIDAYRLAAIFKGGQWWTCEAAVASFVVTKAGRPKKSAPAVLDGSLAVRGGSLDGLSLQVKVEGATLTVGPKADRLFAATLPAGWTRAWVKLTAKLPKPAVRVFVLEPSYLADRLEHGGLSVEGRFAVVEKLNNTAEANAAWRAAGQSLASAS